MVDDPADDAVAFHLPQLLDQHFLRNARNRAFEIGKTQQLAAKKMEEDNELPASFEHSEGLLDTGRSFESVTRATIPYLQARSLGGSLMTLGHLVFAFHIAALLMGKGGLRTSIAGQAPAAATAGA